MLPEAVQRKVQRAVELSKAATTPSEPAAAATPATPAATETTPNGADRVKELEEQIRRLTQANQTLQGKYSAEVPRLAAELRTAKEANAELEAKTKTFEPSRVRSVTDEELEDVGQGALDVITKVAREIATEIVSEQIRPVNEKVDQFRRQTEAQYFATIENGVPDLWTLNEDPGFNEWLTQVDPATRRSRLTLLKDAEALWQGFRVVDIFNAYLEKREIGSRAVAKQSQPKEPVITPQSESGSTPPDVNGVQGKIYSRAEVQNFYRDKARGIYKGEEGQRRAREIELDMFKARTEGRLA